MSKQVFKEFHKMRKLISHTLEMQSMPIVFDWNFLFGLTFHRSLSTRD